MLDTLEYGSAIKKTPVVVGNCTGFAVNRVFFPYTQAACMLVDMGLDPYKIDMAIYAGFGMPMGPFRWPPSCLFKNSRRQKAEPLIILSNAPGPSIVSCPITDEPSRSRHRALSCLSTCHQPAPGHLQHLHTSVQALPLVTHAPDEHRKHSA